MKTIDSTRDEEETMRETEARRYALQRLGDARNKDETIRAAERNSLAKTRPRDCTRETIHDDKDSAIRDEMSKTIRDNGTISTRNCNT